jgi:DUF2950 family protein
VDDLTAARVVVAIVDRSGGMWNERALSRAARLGTLAIAIMAYAAAKENQQTFATPQDAAQALVNAAEQNDTAALLKILGPEGKDIVESGDPADDAKGRAEFARAAREKMHIDQENPLKTTIVVGLQEWPFPVPLVQNDGKWRFDSSKGRLEILARRVGRNELNAVEVCRGYVEAQLEYAAEDRDKDGVLEYAQKIVSSSGKQDGLYWEGAAIVPKAFAQAAESYSKAGNKIEPYHGYYFKVLKAQGPDAQGGAFSYLVKGKMIGGFALIGWPAEYGVSGIHTFIVNHHGLVYQKDLGPDTAALARRVAAFNPDKSWKSVAE